MNYLSVEVKFLNLFINFFFIKFSCACIKISKTLSAKHYQKKNKERLHKKACKRYQSLSKEEKEKKR